MRHRPIGIILPFRNRPHRPRNILHADKLHHQFLRAVKIAFREAGDIGGRSIVAMALFRVLCEIDDKIVRRAVRRIGGEPYPHRRFVEFVRRPVGACVPDERLTASGLDFMPDVSRERQLVFRSD